MRVRDLRSLPLVLLALLGLVLMAGPATAVVGDIDGDTDVDVDDLALILAARGTPASPPDPLDLDGDGTITVLDSRVAAACCTRPLCATGNNPPSISAIADQVVDEDGTTGPLAFTIGDPDGTPPGSLVVTASSDDPVLVPNGNLTLGGADANRTIDVQPIADGNGGPVTITVTVDDGTATTDATFEVTVTAVNDAPSFVAGADETVLEDAGPQVVAGWATAISAGPGNESGQALTFQATDNTNAALFSAGPSIDPGGELTYTPAAGASGSATITVELMDDGGTANGGVDTSTPETFTVTVTGVNNAPSFTVGADHSVLEDAGSQTVPGWATGLSAGPPDEAGQALTFLVTGNTNAALFSAGPAIDPSGELTYTPAAEANGSATITLVLMDDGGTANGGEDTSAPQSFTIDVTSVNDAPSFTAGADETVGEEAGAQTVVGWATAISAGPADESGQMLTFQVTGNTNAALFSAGPMVSAGGDLTYTPAADANGSAMITLELRDDGGTANGGVDTSAAQMFTIDVTSVNDAPSFTVGADETVLEDAGAQTVVGWATGISAGPPDESGQMLTFLVTNNTNAALFSAGPAVSAAGDLTYTPAADANGSAMITLELRDDGGTANGGVDTSAAQMFTIDVTSVNDAPSFTVGADETVLEDAGAQTVVGWATGISAGPPDESGQMLTFLVTNNTNAALFSAGPAVSAAGDLTYTPAADANGSAMITLELRDDGGTANGGMDTSAAQTFTIDVTAVDDPPVLSTPHMAAFVEDGGAVTVAPAITATDVDSATLASATVTLTNAQDGAAEQLGAGACGGLTVGGAGTGVLAISGTAPLATYQACLQSVTFEHTSDTPTESPARAITLVVHDGAADSNPATSTVTVTAVADPPMAEDDAYTTVGNTELVAGAATPTSLARVRDADGVLSKGTPDSDPIEMGTLSIVALQADALAPFAAASDLGGDVAMDASGAFTYVPPVGVRNAVDTFTYTIQNTGGAQDVATVSVTIADGVVWYVHNDPAGEPLNPAGGDGRSNDPFDQLNDDVDDATDDDAQEASSDDEQILVFVGDGGTTGQDLGITLTDGQVLRGQPVDTDAIEDTETVTIGGVVVEVVEPTGAEHGTLPEITSSGGAGITVADRDGVEIRDLEITGSTSGIAVSATTGAMGDTTRVTIVGNVATGSTAGHGVDVTSSGTANLEVVFDDNVVSSGDDDGGGTAFFGARFAGSTFTGTSGTLTVSSFAGNGVDNTAAFVEAGLVFDTVTFDADTSNGTIFSGGTRDVVNAGPLVIGDVGVTRAQSPGLVLTDVRGDLDVDSLEVFNESGPGVVLANAAQAVGDFLWTIDSGSVDTLNGGALDLDPATVAVTLASVATSGAFPGSAVRLADLAGSVDLQGGSLAGAGGSTFLVEGGSADVTYSGSITNTAGFMIDVRGTTAGTVLFDGGTLSDSGTGADTGVGIHILDTAGDVTITPTTTTLTQSDGSGLNVLGAVTGTVRVDGATITDAAVAAVNVDGDSGGVDQITGTIDLNDVDSSKTAASTNGTVIVAGLGAGGSVDFDGASAVTVSNGGGGVTVTSNAAGSVTFRGPVTLATGTSDGVSSTGNTATVVNFLDDLDIDTTTGRGFFADTGTTVVVDSSSSTTTITSGTGSENALRFAGSSIGAGGVAFDVITATGTIAVNPNSFGAIQLTGVSGPGTFDVGSAVIDGAGMGSRGIFITSLSTNADFTSVTIDDTTEALCLNSNTGDVTVGGGTIGATTTTSGRTIDIGNAGGVANGDVTIAASITNSSGVAARIQQLTTGTVLFTGAIDEDAEGILLDGNTGATITFRGGMTLDTGADPAFRAINGGTVNVCPTTLCSGGGTAVTNTIGTSGVPITATAVEIAATAIGAEGVTFRSIDVTNATAPAITLDGTGAGPFTVTGDGTTTADGNGSGGTIANIGADAVALQSTGGLVSLQNVVIEGVTHPNDAADMIQTRTFRDGIHGRDVLGGLRLQSVTLRRFSDNAIYGGVDALPDFTTWNGLEIRDSLLESANRFHVAGRGDDADEGVVRIRGLTGTVVVDNSTFRLGGRGLDLYSPAGAGTLDVTIQRSGFTNLYKEFPAGATRNVGGRAVSLEARGAHDMVVRVGDPAEMDPALGNTFTNGFTASLVVLGQEGGSDPHTGDIDTVISRNTFVVTDHTTAQEPPGNLQFDFPQGGVSLNPGGGTYDAIVSHNLFDEVMHAAGGLGQLTLGLNGGAVQAHVHDNTFRLPWDGSVQIRAESTASAAVLFEDNTWIDGMVGGPGDDVGFAAQSPFNPVLVNVLAGGSLDLTMRREVFPQHDVVFTPADRKHSIEVEVQADSAANELVLHLVDCRGPEGYHFKELNGSFQLFQGVSASTMAGTIVQDNGNRGGAGVDTTNPPLVVTTGTISSTGTAPTLPSITIP